MYHYIIRRLAFGALTVIGVSIVVFFVLRVLPGDPLVAIFGPEGYTKLSEAERAGYMAQLGLSDPLIVQYLHWIGDIARGSLGHSFFRAESVAEMILRRGPLTAEIALLSDDLTKLPHLLSLSRRAMRAIMQNLIFSLSVLAIAVGLAIPGILLPVTGALLHELSSIPVIANSARLIGIKERAE